MKRITAFSIVCLLALSSVAGFFIDSRPEFRGRGLFYVATQTLAINTNFVTTWIVPADGLITIPTTGTGYDGTIAIETMAGATILTDTFSDADMSALTDIDVSSIGVAGTEFRMRIGGTFPRIYFNNTGDKASLKTVENLGHVGWTSFLGAFYGCSGMTTFTTGDADVTGVTSLKSAFYGCTSMASTPDVSGMTGVTTLDSAFRNCSSMVNAPDVSGMTGVTTLLSAFRNCSSMVNAPDVSGMTGVTSLFYAFYGCSSMSTVIVPESINSLTTAASMLQNANNISTDSIDTALNTFAASCQANSDLPASILLHLGNNYYSVGGQASYNYLTGLGWTITSLGLEP